MILICKKCGYQFQSLILDKEQALKDLASKTTRHVAQNHKEELPMMQQVIALAMTALPQVIHFNEYLMIPEQETFIQETVDKQRDIIMAAIGFDPYEDEDQDQPIDSGDTPDERLGLVETEAEEEGDSAKDVA